MKKLGAFLNKRANWVFIAPLVAFILFMALYPIGYTIRLSFYDWSLGLAKDMEWVGLENYSYALTNKEFWQSAWRTVKFAFWAVGFELLFGISLALLVGNRQYRGNNIIKTGFLLPMVATPVTVALTWKLMYDNNYGIINFLLGKIGLFFPALSSVDTALSAYIIIDIWQWTPFIMLLVLAGLAGLPRDPFEAAAIDGATKTQILFKITLPQLLPTIMTAATLRTIDALKAFDIIYAATGGGPGNAAQTLNILLYQEAFSNFRFGRVSAYIVLFCIMILLVTLILLRIRKRTEVDY